MTHYADWGSTDTPYFEDLDTFVPAYEYCHGCDAGIAEGEAFIIPILEHDLMYADEGQEDVAVCHSCFIAHEKDATERQRASPARAASDAAASGSPTSSAVGCLRCSAGR